MKFVDLVNVCAICKRFFIILTTYKEYKQTVSILKRVFSFDDYYTIVTRNVLSGNMDRLNRNLYVMLKFAERPKTLSLKGISSLLVIWS